MRRNNVRIVGLPERIEGRDPTDFIEQWLVTLFGKDAFTPRFSVERAQRTPTRPLPLGHHHRPFLARLLNYRDWEIILRLARERQDKRNNRAKVSFFPDFSAEVQRQRSTFEVKKRLQQLQLTYAMLYPARLQFTILGQTHFFEKASEASTWLDVNESSLWNWPFGSAGS